MKSYKEDSTKGMSLVDPKKYKGDVLVQVWMDSRMLATLSNWLDKEGNYTRFLSEVVKDSLGDLCNHLVESGVVSMIDDTVAARRLLEMKYRVNLNPQGRGEKNKLHNIMLSDRRKSLTGKIGSRVGRSMDHIPMEGQDRGYTMDDLDEAIAKSEMKAREDNVEEAKVKMEEGVQAMRESGQIVDLPEDDPKDSVARKLTEEELDQKAIELEEKDRKYLKELNKPVDVEELKKSGTIVD